MATLSGMFSRGHCPVCGKAMGHHEEYSVFDSAHRISPGFIGCVECLYQFIITAHTPAHNSSADEAVCFTCGALAQTRDMLAIRVDGYACPVLVGCKTCAASTIYAFKTRQTTQLPVTTCPVCRQVAPDSAVRIIVPAGGGSRVFHGCWLCFTKAFPLSQGRSARIPVCEDCNVRLDKATGDNSYWEVSGWYLTNKCDRCFIAHFNITQTAYYKAGAANSTLSGQMQISQQVAQSLLGTGTFNFAPSETKNNSTESLLRLAARYVQVCLEGGDWDIIDATPDISRGLLADIRVKLGLPANHDFTKRETKK